MSPYTVFMRVRHPSIDPAEITAALGLEPAHAWEAGSLREATGGGRASAHPDTYWIAPLGDPGWLKASFPEAGSPRHYWPPRQLLPLEAFLLAQIRLLAAKKPFLLRLSAEGGSAEFAVTLNAQPESGLEFPPGLLRSLAELGMGLSIELSGDPDA